jgi:hypothetical protein
MAMEKNLKIWAKDHTGLEARIDATEKAALSMLAGTKDKQLSFWEKCYNAIERIS